MTRTTHPEFSNQEKEEILDIIYNDKNLIEFAKNQLSVIITDRSLFKTILFGCSPCDSNVKWIFLTVGVPFPF